MILKNFVFNHMRENTMVAIGKERRCVIVDPGYYTEEEKGKLYAYLEAEGLTPEAILLTHCHFDHIFGVADLQRHYGIPVYASPDDDGVLKDTSLVSLFSLRAPDNSFTRSDIHDGDLIRAAGFTFKVITTPGHSPGCCCYYEESEKTLFSGDTLFAGAIGRCDIIFSDYDKEIVSIMDKLMGLPGDTEVHPGHGHGTTIAYERVNNPFLEPFNNPEDCIINDES